MIDTRNTVTSLPGYIVQTDDPRFGGKVFYVQAGIRHWIISADYFEPYGFEWPASVSHVSGEEIAKLKIGGPLPWPWTAQDMQAPPKTDWNTLRELSACTLEGNGIEFGAGTAPFCIPPRCEVAFADFFPEAQLRDRSYQSQLEASADFADLSWITSIEQISGVSNDSQDFIVACHVIEHTRNPIKAIRRCFECLKPNGKLVLVVPDKRLTFDKDRALTPLAHLIDDYSMPDAKRDEQHYYDFCRFVRKDPVDLLPVAVDEAIRTNLDIHFHVWTYDTFRVLIDYIRTTVAPWSDVWSHPPGGGDIANEFYFVCTK